MLLASLLLIAASDVTFEPPVTVSRVVEGRLNGEPCVAVDPQGRIYVAWMDTIPSITQSLIRYTYSHDGGKTFAEDRLLVDDKTLHMVDPTFAFSGDTAWLACTRQAVGRKQADVVLYESKDAGATWTEKKGVTEKSGLMHDRPWLATDAKGRLHLAYMCMTTEYRDFHLVHRRSDDGGATWSDPVRVTPEGSPSVSGTLAVTKSGWIAVATEHSSEGKLYLSKDDGRTFTDYPFTDASCAVAPHGPRSKKTSSLPVIAAAGDDLHIAWIGKDGEKRNRIYVASFPAGAEKPLPPVDAGDDNLRGPTLPALAADSRGTLHLIFTAQIPQRNLTPVRYAVYHAASADGGKTFTNPGEVSSEVFTLERWPGDFCGLAAHGDRLYAAWIRVGDEQRICVSTGSTNGKKQW